MTFLQLSQNISYVSELVKLLQQKNRASVFVFDDDDETV